MTTAPNTSPSLGDLNRLLAAVTTDMAASINRYCCEEHRAPRSAIRASLIASMDLHSSILRLIQDAAPAAIDDDLDGMAADELATMRGALYASLLVERSYRTDLWYVADTGGYWTVGRERGGLDDEWQTSAHYAAVAEAEVRNRRIDEAHRAVAARAGATTNDDTGDGAHPF